MATSVVFVTLGTVFGLILCFSGYSFKEKPYLYARNALIGAFGSLFLITMLIEASFDGTSLEGCGFASMLQSLKTTHIWWETVIKLIVPLVVALTTIFLAELPRKLYETASSVLTVAPLACGLYVSPGVSRAMFIGLVAAYAAALVVVGIVLFKVYLPIETALVGGFLVSWLFKGFYALSTTTFIVVGAVLTVAGAVTTIAIAGRKERKAAEKAGAKGASKTTQDDGASKDSASEAAAADVTGAETMEGGSDA